MLHNHSKTFTQRLEVHGRCAENWEEKVAPFYDVFMFINQNFAGALGERNKAVSPQHLLCESSKAIGGICATLFDLALSSYNCMQ